MGFLGAVGVGVSILIAYIISSDVTTALIWGLMFLGYVSEGEN